MEGILEFPEQALSPCRSGRRRGSDGVIAEDCEVAEFDPQGSVINQRLQLRERVLSEHGTERASVIGVLDHHHRGVNSALRHRVVLLTPGKFRDPGLLFSLL